MGKSPTKKVSSLLIYFLVHPINERPLSTKKPGEKRLFWTFSGCTNVHVAIPSVIVSRAKLEVKEKSD